MTDSLPDRIANRTITTREFLYRLLFDREDGLDMMQVLFLLVVGYTLVASSILLFVEVKPEIAIAILDTLWKMVALLVVTAVPKWLATLMTTKKDTSE